MSIPDSLVLGGGGIRVIAYHGALVELDKAQLLTNIKHYYGVSAGAMVCVLLAANYTMDELGVLLKNMDFLAFQNITADILLDILDTLGADEGNQMKIKICDFLAAKNIPRTITFSQFTELTGKHLHIYATNLNNVSFVHFSAETTPELEVVHAVRISMSVPGWITPSRFPDNRCILVDGGMYNNYPFDCVPAEKRDKTIGITFTPTASTCEKIENIGQYIEQIIVCATLPRAIRNMRRFRDKTILIDVDRFPTFKFDLTEDEKNWLISRGTTAALTFIENRNV